MSPDLTILNEPLPDPEAARRWVGPTIVAAVSLVMVLAGATLARSSPPTGADVGAPAPTIPSTTTALSPPVASERPFPPGYEPIDDEVALRPLVIVVLDDLVVADLSIALSREARAASDFIDFVGWSWVLETTDGAQLASLDAHLGFPLGAASVVFPRPGPDIGFDSMVLVADWVPLTSSATVSAGLAEAIEIETRSGTILLEPLTVPGPGGVAARWAVDGPDSPYVALEIDVDWIDADGRVVAVSRSGGRPTMTMEDGTRAGDFWLEADPVEPIPDTTDALSAFEEELVAVVGVVVDATLSVADIVESVTSVELDLTGVPVVMWDNP